MTIYTKTGDGGKTSLIGGERVSKADPRVEAYGTVDELSAHLALLGDLMNADGRFGEITSLLDGIQKNLMAVEAILATGTGAGSRAGTGTGTGAGAVDELEADIDRLGAALPKIGGFVIPGGHPIVSQSHVCRTVCRRAERAIVRSSEQYALPQEPVRYVNRLSDWLYVVGRKAVEILAVEETYWTP